LVTAKAAAGAEALGRGDGDSDIEDEGLEEVDGVGEDDGTVCEGVADLENDRDGERDREHVLMKPTAASNGWSAAGL
jgi:hypothetical protein